VQEPPLANSEFLEQWNQMKCFISDLKVGMSDLKIASNETRLELADHRGQLIDIMAEIGYRKKRNKNQGYGATYILTTGTAGGVPPPQKYFFAIYFESFSPASKDHHFYLLKVADGCSTR
jgi:hypothetical protein